MSSNEEWWDVCGDYILGEGWRERDQCYRDGGDEVTCGHDTYCDESPARATYRSPFED